MDSSELLTHIQSQQQANVSEKEQDIAPGAPVTNLQHPPASIWSRFWASVADDIFFAGILFFFQGVFSAVISWLFAKNPILGTQIFFIWPLSFFTKVLFPLIVTFLYRFVLTKKYGGPFGKQLYGIKVVVFPTQAQVNSKQVVLREIFRFLYFAPILGFALLLVDSHYILKNQNRRSWRDTVAGTIVVQASRVWSIWKQFLFVAIIFLFYVGGIFGYVGFSINEIRNVSGILSVLTNNKYSNNQQNINEIENFSSSVSSRSYQNEKEGWSFVYDINSITAASESGSTPLNNATDFFLNNSPEYCVQKFTIKYYDNPGRMPVDQWLSTKKELYTPTASRNQKNLSFTNSLFVEDFIPDQPGDKNGVYNKAFLIPRGPDIFEVSYTFPWREKRNDRVCAEIEQHIKKAIETWKFEQNIKSSVLLQPTPVPQFISYENKQAGWRVQFDSTQYEPPKFIPSAQTDTTMVFKKKNVVNSCLENFSIRNTSISESTKTIQLANAHFNVKDAAVLNSYPFKSQSGISWDGFFVKYFASNPQVEADRDEYALFMISGKQAYAFSYTIYFRQNSYSKDECAGSLQDLRQVLESFTLLD